MRIAIAAVLIGAGATPTPSATAQMPPPPVAAGAVMNAVLRFRVDWLEDRTPVEACSLYAQAGEGVMEVLDPEVRVLLDASASCPRDTPRGPTVARQLRVHSVVVQDDSSARVRLLVQKDDRSHIEDYRINRQRLGTGRWEVADVRIWGRLYVTPPRNPQ